MKLATLKNHQRDGQLVVVNRTLTCYVAVPEIAHSLQDALDHWDKAEPQLLAVYQHLNAGKRQDAREFDAGKCHSPLPRAFHWADGSAYVHHVALVRKARGAEMPPSFWTDPLMYQGGSDTFLAPTEDIVLRDTTWGLDFEGEIAVITDDVPQGCNEEQAAQAIKLLMLVNDVSLRELIPGELAKGFGFYQSKPSSSFSPVAVTPDELESGWADGRVMLPLVSTLNGVVFGQPEAGKDMTFNFPQLICHAAKTRALCAGTIIGSGTVSNVQPEDDSSLVINGGVGYSCIAERRMIEILQWGQPQTLFLQPEDHIRLEMLDSKGVSIFGAIDQRVVG